MVKPYFVKHSKVIGLSKSGTFQVKNRQISMKYDEKTMKIAWNRQPTGILTYLELIISTRCGMWRGLPDALPVDK